MCMVVRVVRDASPYLRQAETQSEALSTSTAVSRAEDASRMRDVADSIEERYHKVGPGGRLPTVGMQIGCAAGRFCRSALPAAAVQHVYPPISGSYVVGMSGHVHSLGPMIVKGSLPAVYIALTAVRHICNKEKNRAATL